MKHPLFVASQFYVRCHSWKQAIMLACSPLEQQGLVTANYAQAIVRETEKQGPWYLLTPEFALPHARPEEGVISNETHLSLLCVKEAVCFPGYPDVRLVVVLAAVDSTRHIEKIQQLVCWLEEAERLQQLTHITCSAQLRTVLGSV
ncbi:PTS sugar transporter subunit IIA [Citrobacter sp. RHB21-C05]|uniref:PTS sugar transporter subunit IIA n=1 Tax=Citrobacter TaxID=544 RepID=UPI0015E9C83F|nr:MULTISPECIES: PTS sugar transporter subunit IIA [Citrobacter]EHG7582043.1 PTS transporter subunit EIIA [Citrobacter sedlakii]EIQ7157758.1 PTS sugar transporter subunit IIA [Citrobacter sedlakii]MBN6596891.1 PTS sugar transporter subunit IIA [Citrobacter sedlakii]QMK46632.1 PTS sugar transporter subunit IIA [Citrobacter sp. RHB21-C05]QMK65075.1 PTS sugar transporter subunit IIA [Citrobacter sp. RHB21-C01]